MDNYTRLQKILHRMSLSSAFMREMAFDFEKLFFLDKAKQIPDNHVFVAGLARSGTTILLKAIYASSEFASLSYANMPFLLSPNLWKKFNSEHKHKGEIERAHKDGIMVSTDSPEAFEEVFWQTFSAQNATEQFKNYIALILHSYQKQRYLSKNNQNISRIETLRKLLPNSKILIVFKEPKNHAKSLFDQHQQFSKVQQQNRFIKNYMDWIGHSEFGLSYKPIVPMQSHKDPNHVNHWLEQWYLLYSQLLKKYSRQKNIIFVNGESLRPNNHTWDNIREFIDIKKQYNFKFRDIRQKISIDCEDNLYKNCKNIYAALNDLANEKKTIK